MTPSMFDMTGRVALVTGATKGIGLATAEQFVSHGAKVTIASRSAEECRAVAEQINASTGREAAWGRAFDLKKLDQVQALVDASVDHWGKLDTLVANASVGAVGDEATVDPEVFAKVLRVNVVHNAALAARALPALKVGGDSAVVFVGSASGIAPSPAAAAYGVSKRALLHVMQDLAVQWGRFGIRVNALVPGLTRTPAARGLVRDAEKLKAMTAGWPLQRIGEPEELAAACVFLCSPASRFTTGCALVSDGGRTLVTGNVGMGID